MSDFLGTPHAQLLPKAQTDMKIQTNLFEFVFSSFDKGNFFFFFKSNLLFDRKSQENCVEFCILTGKIQQNDLNFSLMG